MRTAQQLFDIVVKHLRQQGKKALNADGRCCYRGPGGVTCAIGAVIPPEEYLPQMEGGALKDLLEAGLLSHATQIEFDTHFSLLNQLQRVHDNSPLEEWEEGLQAIAKLRGLKLPPLDEPGSRA